MPARQRIGSRHNQPAHAAEIESKHRASVAAIACSHIAGGTRRDTDLRSLLAAADRIWVTADSVAMISDAIWTGKPMALLPVDRNWLGRLILPVSDRLRAGSHAYPQDLRPFWRALAAMGLGEEPAVPGVAPDDILHQTVERVRALIRA